MSRTRLKELPRVCIPGAILNRAIEAVQYPVVLAGPELMKRLEPVQEKLRERTDPSFLERAAGGFLDWLLAAPAPSVESDEADDKFIRGTSPKRYRFRISEPVSHVPTQQAEYPVQEAPLSCARMTTGEGGRSSRRHCQPCNACTRQREWRDQCRRQLRAANPPRRRDGGIQ